MCRVGWCLGVGSEAAQLRLCCRWCFPAWARARCPHRLPTARPTLPAALPSQVIAARRNVCSQLHMPAQSGSSGVLAAMRRGYTREAYDELVAHVRAVIPEVALRWVRPGVTQVAALR